MSLFPGDIDAKDEARRMIAAFEAASVSAKKEGSDESVSAKKEGSDEGSDESVSAKKSLSESEDVFPGPFIG
jgi:hypothetical protein